MTQPLVNLEDYRRRARSRLPRVLFDIVDGAANDEVTMRANRRAFEELALRPRALADVRGADLATTVLGRHIALPVMLAPCGVARLAHADAEPGVARAAGRAGTIYALSTVSSYPPEAVADAATGPLWFQLYPPADSDACRELVQRVQRAGFAALCVTIDGAVLGSRERDLHNRLRLPMRWTPRILWEGLRRPRWAAAFARSNAMTAFGNPAHSPKPLRDSAAAITATANPVTAATIARIRETWDGPLVVKGVLRPEDVSQLISLGVDGLVVSNHGGRQLDTVPATITVLEDIVGEVAGRAEVFLDGGVRRGTDIVKAIALGARAVLVGRPYLFALAAAGEGGVVHMLQILRDELATAMALLGCASIGEVDRSLVASPAPRPPWSHLDLSLGA